MALWSGRFEEGMSDFALKWGASLQDDKIMASQDIAGSIAHATMLAKNGIISEEDLAEKLADEVSLEKFVTGDTPPTFLWHTREDQSVPPENSLLLASALCASGVPFELHLWQRGIHGMSLGSDQVYAPDNPNIHPECQEWIDMAVRWLKELNKH